MQTSTEMNSPTIVDSSRLRPARRAMAGGGMAGFGKRAPDGKIIVTEDQLNQRHSNR
jgi:hypothetical protein